MSRTGWKDGSWSLTRYKACRPRINPTFTLDDEDVLILLFEEVKSVLQILRVSATKLPDVSMANKIDYLLSLLDKSTEEKK